jgi:predicted ATP-grasp superfamily ATP-dependent carboligase
MACGDRISGISEASRKRSAMMPIGKRSGCSVVLGSNDTALNTARCLYEAGIDVRIAYRTRDGQARYTRAALPIDLTALENDEDALIEWLLDYASRLAHRPMLIPCGDHDAIMVSRHHGRLAGVCHAWKNDLSDLLTIVSKDRLNTRASQLGIALPPTITAPGVEELTEWTEQAKPPYFVKPYYLGIDGTDRVGKNQVSESADDLREFVRQNGSDSLIIQKLVRGGDGWIYDCYGLCGHDHRIVTMATHKRIRQHPRDRGVTCYGEIPATLPNDGDQRIFDLTRRLLGGLRYHGIFGIEWIEDRESGEFYLVDFNARPFITIRHLRDCGLNLPLLAYDELTGRDVSAFPVAPALKHKYWIDVLPDARTFRELRRSGRLSWGQWMLSIARCRSFAIFSTQDPLPWLMRVVEAVRAKSRFVFQRASAGKRARA